MNGGGVERAAPERVVLVQADDARARARLRAVSRRALPAVDVVDVRDAVHAHTLLRSVLVEAVLVDLGRGGGPEGWGVAALARQFRHAPTYARTSLAASGASHLARCAALGVTDVVVADVEDATAHAALAARCFSARVARALGSAGRALALGDAVRGAAWERVVRRTGLPLAAGELAASLGVPRERLSRAFGAGAAPTLKRAIDLARVTTAALLLRSPGVGVHDAARILRVPSASQLSALARRTVGTSARGLAELGADEILARFVGAQP